MNAMVDWIKGHRAVTAVGILVLLMTVAVFIALPVMRAHEVRRLEVRVEASSAILSRALQNPALFTGTPDENVAQLKTDAAELSRLHDEVVLMRVHLATGAQRAALTYTDYAGRVGSKLVQVATARRAALDTFGKYDEAVQALKISSMANRAAAQADVNQFVSDTRAATELAYQECVLLKTLTSEFGIIKTQALGSLPSVGTDVDAQISALRPTLNKVILEAHEMRKPFNPAAPMPDLS